MDNILGSPCQDYSHFFRTIVVFFAILGLFPLIPPLRINNYKKNDDGLKRMKNVVNIVIITKQLINK